MRRPVEPLLDVLEEYKLLGEFGGYATPDALVRAMAEALIESRTTLTIPPQFPCPSNEPSSSAHALPDPHNAGC